MAYNTGNPIGSFDPRDAADNKQNFDEFANSTAATYTDRLGVQRYTMTGALQAYANVNPQGAWTTATAYQVGDLVTSGGTTYVVPAAFTSGAGAAADIAAGRLVEYTNINRQRVFPSVAALQAITPLYDAEVVTIAGHTVAGIGGGDFWYDASDTTTADDNGTVIVTSAGERWKRRTDFYTLQMWGVVGDGTDESAAMERAALSGKTIHVTNPPVYYSFKDVKRAPGSVFVGSSKPLYTPDSRTEVEGMSAFVLAEGGTYFWLPADGETRVKEIEDTLILYYGRGELSYFAPGVQRYNNTSCGFYWMLAGIGVNGYAGEVQAVNPNCCNNKYGIRNLVDSKIIGGNINVNEIGVNMQTGANGNEFHGLRVEWNSGTGYEFYGALNNNVMGGLVDRNVNEGVFIGGGASVTLSGTRFNRNGVDLSSPHINLGNCDATLNGVVTRSSNSIDGGGGVDCPVKGIRINGGSRVIISDSDLTGVVAGGVSSEILSFPSAYDFTGNVGLKDQAKHDNKLVRDSRYMTGVATASLLAAGGTATVSTQFHAMSTYSRKRLSMNILARNASSGGTLFGELVFYVSREGGSSSIVYAAKTFDRSGSDVGVTPSETIEISVTNVAADASTFDIVIKNNGTGTLNVDIEIS